MAFPNMNLLVLYLVFLNTFTIFRYDNLTNDFISFEYLDHLVTGDPTISIGISFVKLFIKFLVALGLPTSSGQTEHCSCKKYEIQCTLRYRIRVPVRIFIFGEKFTLYALISSCTFINFGNHISKFSVFK